MLINKQYLINPEEQYEIKETKNIIQNAINKLPFKEQRALLLYDFENLTLCEIGTIMNIPYWKVKRLRNKAYFKLKLQLIHLKENL